MDDKNYQTRSEESGIMFFDTLKEALAEGEKDHSVWKISFSLSSGERVRLVRSVGNSEWVFEPLMFDGQED